MQEISFGGGRAGFGRGPGPSLAGTLYLPASARAEPGRLPGLIVGHGAGSNRRRHDAFCTEASGAGMVVLSLDFRGHGDSGGQLDGPAEEDILAAAEVLRAHPLVDAGRLAYRGSSMGGYYGLLAAQAANFAALALLCPAGAEVLLEALGDAKGKGVRGEEGLYLRYDADALRSYWRSADSLAAAADLELPVLIVHTRGDRVVPLAHSLELARRLRGPTELLIIAGGHHSSAQGSPGINRRVISWLQENVQGA